MTDDHRSRRLRAALAAVYVRAPEPVPQAHFEPEQEKFLAHREAVVAAMVRVMGLVSSREHREEMRSAHARVQKANVAAKD